MELQRKLQLATAYPSSTMNTYTHVLPDIDRAAVVTVTKNSDDPSTSTAVNGYGTGWGGIAM